MKAQALRSSHSDLIDTQQENYQLQDEGNKRKSGRHCLLIHYHLWTEIVKCHFIISLKSENMAIFITTKKLG